MVRSEYVTAIYVNFCGLMAIYLLSQCYLSLTIFLFWFASTDDRTVGR
jgi:hypothetical protein